MGSGVAVTGGAVAGLCFNLEDLFFSTDPSLGDPHRAVPISAFSLRCREGINYHLIFLGSMEPFNDPVVASEKNAGLPNGAERLQINGFLHYKANVISLSILTSGIHLGRESCP